MPNIELIIMADKNLESIADRIIAEFNAQTIYNTKEFNEEIEGILEIVEGNPELTEHRKFAFELAELMHTEPYSTEIDATINRLGLKPYCVATKFYAFTLSWPRIEHATPATLPAFLNLEDSLRVFEERLDQQYAIFNVFFQYEIFVRSTKSSEEEKEKFQIIKTEKICF